MNNNNFSGFGDEIGEVLVEQGKKTVKNVVGGAVGAVKQQVVGAPGDQIKDESSEIKDKTTEVSGGKKQQKLDPVTGKPIPSKKALTSLNQQVAQLAQMRLKKVREELEKQRLKVSEPTSAKATAGEAGPEVKHEEKKPQDDAVQKALKGSKSTGEFKGLVGG